MYCRDYKFKVEHEKMEKKMKNVDQTFIKLCGHG